MRRIAAWLLAPIVVVGVGGCSTIGYYAELADGHFSLLAAREPVDELLADETTPPALKQKLEVAQAIRDYASDTLLLPDNNSYRQYADLKRDVVTWNVVATPAFSLEPKQWCFLIAGCISYRGYYQRESADTFADSLRQQGLDVAVVGSAAYSTLGWFDDPLLNTMLVGPDYVLAALVFHELAHQQLYINDSSEFNEAFATAVEQLGVEQWLADGNFGNQINLFRQRKARQLEFLDLLSTTQTELRALYQAKDPAVDRLQGKQKVFDNLQHRYAALKIRWEEYAGYDHWFARPLNNAHLASVSTYYRWVPAFKTMFEQAGSWQMFYKEAQRVARLPIEDRLDVLEQLLD